MYLNLDRRKLIIIAVVVAVLLLAAIVGGWLYWRQPSTSPTTEPSPAKPTVQLPPVPSPAAVARTPEEEAQESVSRLARLFAERFGTFSSQGRYEGIDDIMAVTTDSFQDWLNNKYMPELKNQHSSATYSGQTTRVMSVTVEKFADDESQVAVRVQQAVTNDAGIVEVKYPVLKVALVKQNNTWLVDSAYWDKTP